MEKTGIALFLYNRLDHSKEVIKNLKLNNIKKLYIFIDGIKKEEHKEASMAVRRLAYDIDWCEKEIVISEKNIGLANSIIKGINYVLEKHERIIVLEDDCVPTEDFFLYMETCLDKYEESNEIAAINGYKYPYKVSDNYEFDIFFTPLTTSWGWATWKREWKLFSRDNDLLDRILSDKNLKDRINYINEGLIPMLKMQINGYLDSWAVYWTLLIIANNKLCVSSTKSKIVNIGLDNSGVHCRNLGKYKIESEIVNVEKKMKFPLKISVEKEILNETHLFFKNGIKGKIKSILFNDLKLKFLYKILKKYNV